jgi:hypothetical protein
LVEDTGKRIFVFFRLSQYNNPEVKVIELEQENVRKQLFPTVCYIIYGSKQGVLEHTKVLPGPNGS